MKSYPLCPPHMACSFSWHTSLSLPHGNDPVPSICSSFILLSMGDLHMSTQEPGTSPADGLVDVVLSSPASDSGLLDMTLQ